jgi:hypothetical protein
MTKTLTISLICFILIGFSNQSNGQSISDQQKSVIEKQVDSVFYISIKAAENLDYDKLSKGVDDKYKSGFIINDAYFIRFDSLINILKNRSLGATNQKISIQKEKITVLSNSIVLLTAFGEATFDSSSGESIITKFYWSFVYEKINKNWKVIQSHQSSYR